MVRFPILAQFALFEQNKMKMSYGSPNSTFPQHLLTTHRSTAAVTEELAAAENCPDFNS